MITVEMCGRLGNQMFQYALALKLSHIGRDVCISTSHNEEMNIKDELGCFREDVVLSCPVHKIDPVKKRCKSWFSRLGGKYQVYHDKIIVYQPEVYELTNADLYGYWQNERYFSDVEDIVRSAYVFRTDLVEKWRKISKKTCEIFSHNVSRNLVSVHVRCTDYLAPENKKIYGNICTVDYYERAILYVKRRTGNMSRFLFFSDDCMWVREVLLPELLKRVSFEAEIIDIDCEDVAMDMWLMTNCDHHIIANSTYSWWAAWLDSKKEKIVVSPSRWMNGYSTEIICENWIKL